MSVDDAGGGSAQRLFTLLPLLWELFNELPPDDSRGRASLVRGMTRLARHARPVELARATDLLVPLLQLLSEDDAPTRAACEAHLPRLLAHAPFVRAVAGVHEA